MAGRRRDRLDETLAGYDEERVLAVQADVSVPAEARSAVDAVVSRFGVLDVFVNNAAKYLSKPFVEMTGDEWDGLRTATIDAFVYLAQRALPELEHGGVSLVAVGSVSGMRGDWGQSGYNATNALIMNFVQSLALDYGSKVVRINAVAPAFTHTETTAGVGTDAASLTPFVNRIALGRAGQPDDIAPAVLFLASADAAYITGSILTGSILTGSILTGSILTVDGGTTASTGQPHIE